MSNLTVFYDALCPLCVAEINWLRATSQNTVFEDLNDPNCSAYSLHLTKVELRARLYGCVDGVVVVSGLEVFREMYTRSGKGYYLAWTAWPGVRKLADFGYTVFARNRGWLSRLAAKTFLRKSCDSGTCYR